MKRNDSVDLVPGVVFYLADCPTGFIPVFYKLG